jgi:hypothetical protein
MLVRRAIAVGLLLVSAAGPCRADTPLTPEVAKRLLAEAAAMPRAVLDEVVRMGAMVKMSDLAALGNFPLTLAIMVLDANRWGPSRPARTMLLPDLKEIAPRPDEITSNDVVQIFRAPPSDPGMASRAVLGDSLLQEHFITELTLESEGDRAHGRVSFRLPGWVEGTLEWVAARGEKGWHVRRFAFPRSPVSLELRQGRWHVCRGSLDGCPHAISPGELALAPSALCRVGLLQEEELAGAFHVAVTEEGRLLTSEGLTGTDALGRQLLLAGLLGPRDRDSHIYGDALLRLEAGAPWALAAQIFRPAGAPEEYVLRRPAFAVAPDGSAAQGQLPGGTWEGVLFAHLPAPGSVAADAVPLRVVLTPDDRTASRAASAHLFARALESRPPAQRHAVIAVAPPGALRCQHVVSTVDLLFRSGATTVSFEDMPDPRPPDHEAGPGSWEALMAYARSLQPLASGVKIVVEGHGAVELVEPPSPPLFRTGPAGYRRP